MDSLIKEMEQYAQENSVPIMQSEGIEFLSNFIKEHKVKRILEIGAAIGYSAIRMAMLDEDIEIVTVERDDVRYKEALKNIHKADMDKRIRVVHADALEFNADGLFDLIFIDAAKAQYIKFFERYNKNLDKDGSIISDNLKFHGMVDHYDQIKNRNTKQLVRKIQRYITYLEDNKEYDTTFYDIGDGIAASKKR